MGKDKLVQQARTVVRAVAPEELVARQSDSPSSPLIVDVREPEEVSGGRIAGATHIPRGWLELRIEAIAGLDTCVVVYCQSGVRSLLAAKTLKDMGYTRVESLDGGFEAWKGIGGAIETPPSLSAEARARYARQLTLKEIGESGQLRLQEARVLVIGAGGLGSPALLYLAGAGVGTLGVVDDDVVDLSNLHRQVIHRSKDAGLKKVDSAKRAIEALNSDVSVQVFDTKIDEHNADDILAQEWDVVIDGSDRIPTRYLLNDACIKFKIPLVYGAVHTFEGQVTVFAPHLKGPCYRCLFPTPPPPEATPNCSEAGVLGVLPGVVGLLQATQALHLILGTGDPMMGRIVRFDGLKGTLDELYLPKDPACIGCGG